VKRGTCLRSCLESSKSRHAVRYAVTMRFLRQACLPCTEVIPIAEEDLQATERFLTEYDIKPSDAIHLATMEKAGIALIASEDEDFDAVRGIRRIWLDEIR